jgi:hypothetical protein
VTPAWRLATRPGRDYDRRMRTAWAAALLAAAIGTAGCGPATHRAPLHDDADDTPEFSAAHLGDPFDDDSVGDMLNPAEREAVRQSGMTGVRVDPKPLTDAPKAPPQGPIAHALDVLGNITVAVLGVAVTIGMAIAPFFAV